MDAFLKKNWFKILSAAALIALIAVMAFRLMGEKQEEVPHMKPAPDFTLQNIDGKTVSLADLKGKTVLMYFFWANCPDVCSPTTFRMSQIQEQLQKKGSLGEKTMLVSITVDPERDTAEALKTFSSKFNADPKGWLFLRGEEKKTAELAQNGYGVFVQKDKNGNFTHSNYFLLVDGKGEFRTYYSGDEDRLDVDRVVRDMIQVSKEK